MRSTDEANAERRIAINKREEAKKRIIKALRKNDYGNDITLQIDIYNKACKMIDECEKSIFINSTTNKKYA